MKYTRKQFIKEICEKGKFDGQIITIKLGDVQRIADKIFVGLQRHQKTAPCGAERII